MIASTPGMPAGPEARATRGAAARGAPPPAAAGCGRGGAAPEPPPALSAVSAIMTDVTPGTARTACSARARTLSHCFTAAASTVMEKNTLPSLATMSESLPLADSGTPSGPDNVASLARTSSLSNAMAASTRVMQTR